VPSGADCDSFNPQPCVSESGFSAFPHYLTVGAKSAPLGPGLILNTGVDLGLTTAESQGTPAVPAWNWIFGISYDLDPTPPTVAAAAAPSGDGGPVSHLQGVIVDSDTGSPINGARVSYPGLDFTDQITSGDGRFRSFDFTPGEEVTIELSHPAYEPRELSVTISETVREGQIALTAAFTGTRLTGNFTFGGQAAPVSILLTGERTYELEVPEGEANYVLDVEPGTYTLLVAAPGHTTEVSQQTLELGRVTENIELVALPSGADLRRTPAGVVVVDGSEGVTFDAEENLTAAGQGVLDELAAIMQDDPSLRIRVRSHVDDRGDTELESSICSARAQSVIDYLTGRGIAAGRLQPEAVGAIEPLFPNISDRNRSRNNRVEFAAIR
jgi:outer membrane protein OmpA-like peptidoglycan-associated protein